MSEMRLLEEFAQWLKKHRVNRMADGKEPLRFEKTVIGYTFQVKLGAKRSR